MLRFLSGLVFWAFLIFLAWLVFFGRGQMLRAEGSIQSNPLDWLRDTLDPGNR